MGAINIPDINNGEAADAQVWNTRFAQVASVLNGNVDAANLADDAVSSSKISNGAVTGAKVADNTVPYTKIQATTIPHGMFIFSAASGYVANVGTTTVLFNTLETNEHSGIVKNADGVLQVQQAGVYLCNLILQCVDAPTGTVSKIEYSVNGGTTWLDMTNWSNRQTMESTSRGTMPRINAPFLPANTLIRGRVDVSANSRFGYSGSSPYTSSLSVTRIA